MTTLANAENLNRSRRSRHVVARAALLVGLTLGGLALLAAAMPANSKTTVPGSSPTAGLAVPAPTGAFHVGTRSIQLIDRDRREPEAPKQPRSLVIQAWFPAAAGTQPASYMPPAVARFLASTAGVHPELLESVKLRRDG